jgi:hypothetical protein
MDQATWACAFRGTASAVTSLATMRTTGNRVPPDCAALLLAGLLVAYGATRRDGADRAGVKVMDALEHSVGLSISPAMAAIIFRRDLKLTVVRVGGKQNYVVGLSPAAIARLWAQIR